MNSVVEQGTKIIFDGFTTTEGFKEWLDQFLTEKEISPYQLFRFEIAGDLHVVEMAALKEWLVDIDDFGATFYKSMLIAADIANLSILAQLESYARGLIPKVCYQGICDICQEPFTADEWDDRHSLHEDDCGYLESGTCECSGAAHARCYPECNE